MRSTATPIRAAQPSPRLRPGERPAWWDASTDRDCFQIWRSAAERSDLALDTWASLLVELELVLADLGQGEEATAQLDATLAGSSGIDQLGPASALRSWLGPQAGPCEAEDELPEVLLPERLHARLTPGASLQPYLRAERIELARACDRQAALAGRTMESWALSAALRSAL